MIFRIAKQSDYKILADIHMECGKAQIDGFMHKLGKSFLKTYYKILLNEKNAIVLIAEDENEYCVGFHSGTTKAEEHLLNLKRHKFILALSLLTVIIRKPKIISDILKRNRHLSSENKKNSFGVKSGPRAEYWAWRPSYNKTNESISLQQTWCNILFELGYDHFKLEVDISNKNVFNYYKILGCKIIEEINLQDHRKRVIIQYSLTQQILN